MNKINYNSSFEEIIINELAILLLNFKNFH